MKYVCEPEGRTNKGNLKYLDTLRELARKNSNNPTKAEALFWNMLMRKDKPDYRFLRQKPIGKFIVDFYCSKLMLVVELDGSSHELKDYPDFERSNYLNWRGIKVIRYSNYQVFKYLENVYCDLLEKIKERERELKTNPLSSKRKTPR